MAIKYNIVLLILCMYLNRIACELWKQDLSDSMDLIEPSTEGLKKVNLKCGANSMHVELQTEEEFTGVMYTRGSFHKQGGPCFGRGKGGRALSMSFPLDECQTAKEGDVYSNVVVVQHDPDLVTPGDAAFSVECDFRKPRELHIGADMLARGQEASQSSITLDSPDPSAYSKKKKREKRDTIRSDGASVTYTPPHLH